MEEALNLSSDSLLGNDDDDDDDVTCILTVSIFIIYALILFYRCTLYHTAFLCSCIMSVTFVM